MTYPKGKGSVSHTKTLTKVGLWPESVASSQYRGRPWRGWMFLWFLFFAPKKWTYPFVPFRKGNSCA